MARHLASSAIHLSLRQATVLADIGASSPSRPRSARSKYPSERSRSYSWGISSSTCRLLCMNRGSSWLSNCSSVLRILGLLTCMVAELSVSFRGRRRHVIAVVACILEPRSTSGGYFKRLPGRRAVDRLLHLSMAFGIHALANGEAEPELNNLPKHGDQLWDAYRPVRHWSRMYFQALIFRRDR